MVLLLCLLIGFSLLYLAVLLAELTPLQRILKGSVWAWLRRGVALGALLPFLFLTLADSGRRSPLPPDSAEASREETRLERASAPLLPLAARQVPEAFPAFEEGQEPDLHWLIHHHSARYGVDPFLVLAVVQEESQFEPRAVSSKGAIGLMQITRETAEYLGLRDPFDVGENIEGGVRYLQMLLERHDWDLRLALASYNAGPTKVERYGGIPPYPETERYIARVMARYRNLKRMAEVFRHKRPVSPLLAFIPAREKDAREEARPAGAAPAPPPIRRGL